MRKLNLKFFTAIALSALLIGCSGNKKTEEAFLNDAKTKLDEKKYDESIAEYREFLKNYPKSDKAIFAYNQIAGIQIDNLSKPLDGIKTYSEMAEKFPNTKDAKQAMFMVAFMYDETLKDKDNAIKSYKLFLEKYPTDTDPNDKMSESAKTMLEVLQSGKPIEQIIQESIQKSGGQNSSDTSKMKDDHSNSKQLDTSTGDKDKQKSDEKSNLKTEDKEQRSPTGLKKDAGTNTEK